jgi:acetylornithine deacetylase
VKGPPAPRFAIMPQMNTAALLDRLVGFPTVSRESNLGLIGFVAAFLASRNIASRLFKDPSGRKASLFATVGPSDREGGVLLSGHTDVVPVDGQDWSSDPFRLTARGEAVYGRGTADMKGFLACALAAVDRAVRRQLCAPLQLAFSYDEEIGCVGVRSLIEALATFDTRPALCIVGEPTMMKVAVGHKGKTALKVRCAGHAIHSALAPRGVNAIHLASDFVQDVRALQARLENSGARESGYDIPYSTLHVGRIDGGTALNIVPDRCELEMEIRNVAADSPRQLIETLRSHAARIAERAGRPDARAEISIEVTNEYPGLATPETSQAAGFVSALSGESECIRVAFGSEAGLFSRIGIPTVLCGPGSIGQAHRPDEFVTREQLARCDAMMNALLDKLSGGDREGVA